MNRKSRPARKRLNQSALCLVLSGLTILAAPQLPVFAQGGASADEPTYFQPLGIALEEYRYPYLVRYMPLTLQGKQVRMAYMDVSLGGVAETPGSTVLLLHGKNFYGSYWADTIHTLIRAGHRVIVPDQIGFGKSSKPALDYSFDLLAANTIALLDQLKVQQVDVVGHSMGGMLAVRLARAYPQRVRRVVLENPIGLEDYRLKVPPQSLEQYYQTELQNTDSAKIRAFLRRYVAQWQPGKYERFVEVRSRITLGGEYPRWAMASALTSKMIYDQPVVQELPLIKAPVLLAIGQLDRTTIGRDLVDAETAKTMGQYPQLGRAAAQAIPNSKLVEFPEAAHIPHLEIPEIFHAALLDFLRG